jgi:hypothetical protein
MPRAKQCGPVCACQLLQRLQHQHSQSVTGQQHNQLAIVKHHNLQKFNGDVVQMQGKAYREIDALLIAAAWHAHT